MAKKVSNHKADIKNPNYGTRGVNKVYAKAQGNRGKMMNPNWYFKHPQHMPKSAGKGK
jgi:glycerate kinase